jgi:hypothetical protein
VILATLPNFSSLPPSSLAFSIISNEQQLR